MGSRKGTISTSYRKTKLSALSPFQWFQKKDETAENMNELKIRDLNSKRGGDVSFKEQEELEIMHRTAKMMEDHCRSQEASERTLAMMEELSNALVVGKSKAGPASGGIAGIGGVGSGERKGGVKVTFDGQRRPISVSVDPNFLFSTSSTNGSSDGVISIEELNSAITDAMQEGYELSGKLMEEKMKGLYEQLGLPREPPSFSSK